MRAGDTVEISLTGADAPLTGTVVSVDAETAVVAVGHGADHAMMAVPLAQVTVTSTGEEEDEI